MRFAILSRNRGLHSIRRLLQEAKKARIQCDVINPLECQLIVDPENCRVIRGNRTLPPYDAILPRIGASITDYGIAVVKQFEILGAYVVNGSRAIAESRDKMRCLQVLTEAGLQVPITALGRSTHGLRQAVNATKGLPVVAKLLRGTQGVGVMLFHTPISLKTVVETFRGLDEDLLLQQFIAEGAGRDYRAFVVGNRVIAAMMRTAKAGEFRSNIHQGGEGTLVKLPANYQRAAVLATKTLGLEVAGVDIMASHDGPMILEVNSSPGFEGIEKATGLNIAAMIVRQMQKHALSKKRSAARKKAARKKANKRNPASKKKKQTAKKPARRKPVGKRAKNKIQKKIQKRGGIKPSARTRRRP